MNTQQQTEETNPFSSGVLASIISGAVEGQRCASSAILVQDATKTAHKVRKVSPDDYIQLSICLRPHACHSVKNGKRVYNSVIPRGGVATFQPGDEIDIDTTGPTEMLLLFLSGELLESVVEQAGLAARAFGSFEIRDPNQKSDRTLHHLASKIANLVYAPDAFNRLRMDLASQEAAVQLISDYSDFALPVLGKVTQVTAKGLDPKKLSRAMDIMSDPGTKDLSLNSIAGAVGCSPTHFSRAFRASTGLNPFEWLVHKRIDRAKDLLARTDLALVDVALDVGFAAQPQFTTAFRRLTGITPGRWRTRAR